MLPESAHRVAVHTSEPVNHRIRRRTERRIAYFARRPELIGARLRQLDREWDTERVLETLSSTLSLVGLLRALRRGRRWLLVPLGIQAFFLQHALQGWCPPLPLLRRLGVRTPREIGRERYALKAIRGDFDCAPQEEAVGADAGL
jgi:hypothetical protein